MKTMQSFKRASQKPISRVRDLSSATKVLITGNGNGATVTKIQKDIDKFLDDLEALDQAAWKVVRVYQQKLYKFLDMVGDRGKDGKKEGTFDEVKTAWARLTGSASTLGRDTKRVTSQLRQRASDN